MKPNVSIDSFREKKYNKVFIKLPSKSSITISGQPLFEAELSKKGKFTKNKKFFRFFEDFILLYSKKNLTELKAVAFFDFDLKLEWLYQATKEKTLGKLFGLKLLRHSDCVELDSTDESFLKTLIGYFQNKLNLCGFHDHFKPIKKIGKGNFATVYLANNELDNGQLAVKAFSKEAAYSEENGKESLVNEINIMRSLNHPNLIKLHEVYETENSLYMVMELLNGGNLVDYLKTHGKQTEKSAGVFLKALLKGIAYLHEKGIMHRDLKPENILFRNTEMKEENICIADFGLATNTNVDQYLFSRCGTPGFVAPEVVNIKDLTKKYDSICDEFSIGVIFHILLFGKSIFPGKTYNEVLTQNRACDFNFTEPLYKKITLDALDLLIKLLEVKPEKRIKAKDALVHPFFSQNEPHDFYLENLQKRNSLSASPIESPIRVSRNSFSIYNEDPTANTNSVTLVTRRPCLNGYTNTLERLSSGNSQQNSDSGKLEEEKSNGNEASRCNRNNSLTIRISKFGLNEKEAMASPDLRNALKNSDHERKKLSIFNKGEHK